MRRRIAALLVPLMAVPILVVMLGAGPAGANSYPGLYEKDWTWSDANGNAYTLTARIAIEVTTAGNEGRFRLRLKCTRTDSVTGRTAPNDCLFEFDFGLGHVGAVHAICSYRWTKGGSTGSLYCPPS
jgi:hypothetical protein